MRVHHCKPFRIQTSLVMSLALLGSYLQLISTSQDLAAVADEDAPDFSEPIPNVTVPVGRDVHLPCVVTKLGDYRAAWLRVEDKGILTIHQHVITRNYRVSLIHSDNRNFILLIRNVQESDRGGYMCQINTVPMRSQVGYLDVVVPPDIVVEESSSDVVVTEGSNVTLKCKAKGYPSPSIKWKREDSSDIPLHSWQDKKYTGESLTIVRVTRVHMGAYLCIASNGVPPSVSRRILLHVHFAPVLWIPNKSIRTSVGKEVGLDCHFEGFPAPNAYWVKPDGDPILAGEKYEISVREKSYKSHLRLTIRSLEKGDFGTYKCTATNPLGTQQDTITLYEGGSSGDMSTSSNRRQKESSSSSSSSSGGGRQSGTSEMEEQMEESAELMVLGSAQTRKQQDDGHNTGYNPGKGEDKSSERRRHHQGNNSEKPFGNRILAFIAIFILIPLGLT